MAVRCYLIADLYRDGRVRYRVANRFPYKEPEDCVQVRVARGVGAGSAQAFAAMKRKVVHRAPWLEAVLAALQRPEDE